MANNILDLMSIPDYNPSKSSQLENTESSFNPSLWPSVFPKPVIGIEKIGTITEGNTHDVLPGALDAVRQMRLKGYKVVMLNDERGKTPIQVDVENQRLMDIFGKNGIFSIDTMYYSIGTEKADIYVKPSTGMFKRCEKEFPACKFKEGWYIGTTINDAKAAFKIGARPVLINPNEVDLKKLNSYSNQKLKKKTRVFNTLLEFANTLK
jgi:histidinol phosphatase-like enzyme